MSRTYQLGPRVGHSGPGWVPRRIDEATLRAAEALGEYYAEHALAVFGESATDTVHSAARKTLNWLQNRAQSSPYVTHRDLFAAVRGKSIPRSDDLNPAVQLLEELGWVRQAPSLGAHAPGRPSRKYLLHPTLCER